jgi:hypothetical protein
VKFTLEGFVTPSAESIPGGVRLRLIEAQQVEYHLTPGDEGPEGWAATEDGLVARGPEHVLTAVVEVSLPIPTIMAMINELVQAANKTMADDPKLAAEVGGYLGAGPNGLVVPDIVLPPGIDLRRGP